MSAREVRKHAKAILAQVELIRDPGERAGMLAIARAYLRLADLVGARHQRGTSHRAGDQRPRKDS
jgi:hypothetical protein